jgi:DnaJ-class molecular chaperone
MSNPYSILGIEKSADAAQIKRAYRKLAKELHPDRNPNDKTAADRFKQVTAAYDLLSDPDKRGQYDRGEIDSDGNPRAPEGFGFRGGRARPGNGGYGFEGDPSDLFSDLFRRGGGGFGAGGFGAGGFRPPPAKGADVQYRLEISLADAALARPQRITLSSGSTIDLSLPKGVEDGDRLRLGGKGEDGPGGPGDAYVTLVIRPDPRFTREGDDVRTDILVPLETAVLGGEQRVPTLEGEVKARLQPGTSSGKVLRLRGKGWTRKDGSRGDLLARVLVDVPAGDTALAEFLQSRAAAG